jgi:DNA-binding CsgD family transcriptional regulator/DNA-binding Lrp family transcriptional regulator
MAVKKVIKHYGIKRRSGRYPWGSGEDPYQRGSDLLGAVDQLKKQGLNEVEIARGLGMSTKELRERKSLAKAERRAADRAMALRLKEKGYSDSAIGRRMGKNESSIRSLLNESLAEKAKITETTANVLADAVGKKTYIDVGAGVEQHLGISRTKLNTAVRKLEDEGYEVYYVQVKQLGTDKYTSIKVLAPPLSEGQTRSEQYSELARNKDQIALVDDYSVDGGRTFLGIHTPTSISSDRIFIRYGDEGGSAKDGVIELRPGVDDISLGDSSYAQVRVAVDGKLYMKGMAMYSKDIPDGFDIAYNTNKKSGTPIDEVYKKMEADPDNPFGSTIRQRFYIDANGKERLSALNIVGAKEGAGEEGAWDDWSRNLSSQILSKQTPALAQKQLALAFNLKKEEFDEIMSLTNPTIQRKLLTTFADEADAAAVHLKAAALPRQASQVLLPFRSIKEGEVYAPNYDNGENVVLIRHPHGGIFEIPELIVNNRNAEAKSLIGSAKDAVGINPKVAARLSGADFDGDTVIVIPNKNRLIRTAPALKELKGFDPQTSYPGHPGMKKMSNDLKQLKMGDVSNLITDMTIKGASHGEIARAVKHSMVVIDAEKHNLNWRLSYQDNGIGQLKEKYQGKTTAGASTLISRAKATIRIPFRKEGQYVTDPKTGKTKRVYIDPKTGRKLYEETGETYVNRQGKTVPRLTKSSRMAEVTDAHKLSSGTVMERIYANHANQLKNLANTARLQSLKTKDIPYSSSAKKTFKDQVSSLTSKLSIAIRNKPLERQAQLLANKVVAAKRKSNPDMDADTLKKIKGQALEEARARVGAKKVPIQITDREWQAIQAGAISPSRLKKILDNTDTTALKERALPRSSKGMSSAKVVRARTMLSAGYTRGEIAKALGVSVSTLSNALED